MKKKMILLVVSIVIIIIIASLFIIQSGENEKDKFIGKWRLTSTDYDDPSYITTDIFLTFNPDGTFYTNLTTGTWELYKGDLRIIIDYTNPESPFGVLQMGNMEYTFSDDNNNLKLYHAYSHVADFTIYYEKVSN